MPKLNVDLVREDAWSSWGEDLERQLATPNGYLVFDQTAARDEQE